MSNNDVKQTSELSEMFNSDLFQENKRWKVVGLFLAFAYVDYLFIEYEWRNLIVHPVCQLEYFLFAVFFSLVISWKMYDLRNERDQNQQALSIISPGIYALMNKSKDVEELIGKEVTKRSQKFKETNGMSSILFFLNLVVGGYIALCISHAVITRTCMCCASVDY